MHTGEKSSCAHGGSHQHHQEAEIDRRLQAQLQHIRHKILVMSGKGGVGKTSVALYLALGLAQRGYQVGLLDVDLHGPDIPRMLGLSGMFQADAEGHLSPMRYNDYLQVVSIECLMPDRDEAVIWRGPLKHSFIQQSLSEITWGELDVLIIDAPPGTGDEPLSVAQTITGVQAVIVTTPQEISLADVRKSINFCRQVNMPILGLVENMSGFICPRCGEEIPLFSRGGGQKTADAMEVPLLASLPFDLRVMQGGDSGQPWLASPGESPYLQGVEQLLIQLEARLTVGEENPAPPAGHPQTPEGPKSANP